MGCGEWKSDFFLFGNFITARPSLRVFCYALQETAEG
jgi:hypothetical protein